MNDPFFVAGVFFIPVLLAFFVGAMLGRLARPRIDSRATTLLADIVASSQYINYGPRGFLVEAHLISEAKRLLDETAEVAQ